MTSAPGGTGDRHRPDLVPAVYFLSDYGTVDEFVGVVHAVLFRLAPVLRVIDLSHQVPAFDVVAGAAMLVRSVPHLGSGVVLAVVDPGVGTERRGVALETDSRGPRFLVGPDNGLLLPVADWLGGVRAAVALDPVRTVGDPSSGTFDGRDLFAPAAAHLAQGGDLHRLGEVVDPASLIRVPTESGESDPGTWDVGGSELDSPVSWIDRFGNIQLATVPEALSAVGVALGGLAVVTTRPAHEGGGRSRGPVATPGPGVTARRVRAFGHLSPGELGLLEDANGRVSVVLDRASAARALALEGAGAIVHIVAVGPPGDGKHPASGG